MATHIFSSKNEFVLSKILPYSKYINLTQTWKILNCDGGFHVFGGGVGAPLTGGVGGFDLLYFVANQTLWQ